MTVPTQAEFPAAPSLRGRLRRIVPAIVESVQAIPLRKLRWWTGAVIGTLYLAAVSPHWYMLSDSALYLMLGEHLAAGDGYTLGGHPHAYVPPGYPLLLAAMMRLGLGSYFWLNLSTALAALAMLSLADRVLRTQASQRVALMAIGLFGVGFVLHRVSSYLLSDMLFCLLVWAGLYAALRGRRGHWLWWTAAVLAFVASCWVRVVGLPLAAGAAVGLVLQADPDRRRTAWCHAIGLGLLLAATATTFLLWHRWALAEAATGSYAHHAGELSEREVWEWLWVPAVNFLGTGRQLARLLFGDGDNLPRLMALFLVWGPVLVGMRVVCRRGERVCVAATVVYVGSILLLRSLISRYLLPVAPLLVLYFVEGLHHLWGWRPHARRLALGRTLAVVLIAMVIHVGKDVRWAFHRQYPGLRSGEAHWPLVVEAANALNRWARPGERFASAHETRPMAYLSRVPFLDVNKTVMLTRPDPDELRRLLEAENVRLIAVSLVATRPFEEALLELLAETRHEHLVFRNERFEIYRLPVDSEARNAKRETRVRRE